MLRRVAWALRILLLAMGLMFLALLPASFRWIFYLNLSPGPFIWVGDGAMTVHLDPPLAPTRLGVETFSSALHGYFGPIYFLPTLEPRNAQGFNGVVLPLWLLAVLCLAWPVTSFVIARRRRGTRGFEVEPSQRTKVGTNDSPTLDL